MRGAGRMKQQGFNVEWGVGRHGPGDNIFSYFIEPNGFVTEYTAEVEQIDEANGRVTVMLSIFGRSTPVDIEYWQIEGL